MRFISLFILLIALHGTSLAVQPNEMLADPQLEVRARQISEDLRCLVCQNQSIDDSDADLAHDLRVLVRQRLKAGDSDAAVKEYLVDRYGDYILLNPPFKASTYALWISPLLFLFIGLGFAFTAYQRAKAPSVEKIQYLSQTEQRKALDLLNGNSNAKGDE